MISINMSIDGVDDTVRKINHFDLQKQADARGIIKETATNIRKKGKAAAPKSPASRKKSRGRPGDLKGSIQAKYFREGLGAVVLPKNPKGAHRFIVSQGTVNRRAYSRGNANRGRGPAQPFMDAAHQAAIGPYNAKMRALFEGSDTEV